MKLWIYGDFFASRSLVSFKTISFSVKIASKDLVKILNTTKLKVSVQKSVLGVFLSELVPSVVAVEVVVVNSRHFKGRLNPCSIFWMVYFALTLLVFLGNLFFFRCANWTDFLTWVLHKDNFQLETFDYHLYDEIVRHFFLQFNCFTYNFVFYVIFMRRKRTTFSLKETARRTIYQENFVEVCKNGRHSHFRVIYCKLKDSKRSAHPFGLLL